ncbi:LuxR C-terminal-related transcriptional regulator [Sphingomonas sp. SUN019]|uniref:helix-turn-helix transcriptional regulator n=1 Tax=Sphingomonas sp. SUN019 TaxID=2937788 RepID=UPI002164994B|nr:LuxR C-terminal-related transcriptional regulator [Sphingomonas sp. SUN019]UVO51981.1 LuxR C-terminal-related transcriptional regulator [Sphingomonas sp. SUN019]
MRPRPDIVSLTGQIVADCTLDTASIFFYDETCGVPALSYLHHVNVSEEAQHCYAERVFESDPFTRSLLVDDSGGRGRFVRWGERSLAARADHAPDYRAFLSQHGIDVVGAWTRRLTPHLCLIVGTHRARTTKRSGDVPVALLEHRLGTLADLVATQLFEEVTARESGCLALRHALGGADEPPTLGLTAREAQIANLICAGKQNKEIAYLVGLSQFTIENHLRRIYRKLHIHNRAALVARMSRQLH